MASTWGSCFKISIFGESHGAGIGVVIDGVPPGVSLDLDALQAFMVRRAPGNTPGSTTRRETDAPEILSGFFEGRTTGAPLAALIRNNNTHSKDYSDIATSARPGHADYTGFLRYAGCADYRGGGHFSGRLTAPLCFAGGVAKQLLETRGVSVGAHALQIGGVRDESYPQTELSAQAVAEPGLRAFPTISESAGIEMAKAMEAARSECDSIGGIVECAAVGFPAGVGSPMFDGIENRLASIVFGIPAVKGLEFGDGFAASSSRGSLNNDEFLMRDGQIVTKTNHAGGILGGISSGMPIIFRAAFKPTPSIAREQQTVDFAKREQRSLTIKGRHDPCVVARAVPVVEAAASIALADALLEANGCCCKFK